MAENSETQTRDDTNTFLTFESSFWISKKQIQNLSKTVYNEAFYMFIFFGK